MWRGELQTRGLGMAVEVWNEAGEPVVGEPGELVCTKPFPSCRWASGTIPTAAATAGRTSSASRACWTHGDHVELTAHDGLIIYGRSDAVLNPGGVRIGTAEIYRQVEQIPEVVEALAVGQEWDGDQRVVLFVRLAEGAAFDDALVDRIRRQIRTNCTPRHVPAKIVPIADIPRTMNNKIAELAVREVIHGRPVKNVDALANPRPWSCTAIFTSSRPEAPARGDAADVPPRRLLVRTVWLALPVTITLLVLAVFNHLALWAALLAGCSVCS